MFKDQNEQRVVNTVWLINRVTKKTKIKMGVPGRCSAPAFITHLAYIEHCAVNSYTQRTVTTQLRVNG